MKNSKIDLSKLRRVATEDIEGYKPMFPKPKKKLKKDRSKLQVRKDNPNSGYHKKRADKAWGEYQHHFFRTCIVDNQDCKGPLNAHHLVSRGNVFLRHEPENCAMLCVWHHQYSTTCSPHAGPIGFTQFLHEHYGDKFQWVHDNQHKTGKPNYKEAFEHLTEVMDENL